MNALPNLQSLKRPWLQSQLAFHEAFQKSGRVEHLSGDDWILLSTSRWPKGCPVERLRVDALMLITSADVFGIWSDDQLNIISLENPKKAGAKLDLDVETIDQAWESGNRRFYQTMPRESDEGAIELRQAWRDMVRGCVCYLVGSCEND